MNKRTWRVLVQEINRKKSEENQKLKERDSSEPRTSLGETISVAVLSSRAERETRKKGQPLKSQIGD